MLSQFKNPFLNNEIDSRKMGKYRPLLIRFADILTLCSKCAKILNTAVIHFQLSDIQHETCSIVHYIYTFRQQVLTRWHLTSSVKFFTFLLYRPLQFSFRSKFFFSQWDSFEINSYFWLDIFFEGGPPSTSTGTLWVKSYFKPLCFIHVIRLFSNI
jgi:hypothetical protein